MPESYKAIEDRLTMAIDAINTRNNAKLVSIAQEFDVLRGKLRARLNEHPPKSDVRGLHNRALELDQELALREYIIILDKMHIPARLHMIQTTANDIHRLAADPANPPSRSCLILKSEHTEIK